jgi:predicted transcriptional regulator
MSEFLNQPDPERQLRAILSEIGLNEREIEIYVCMIKIGAQPSSVIAKHVEMNRTTVYQYLQRLERARFIYSNHFARVKYFQPYPLTTVVEKLGIQRENLDRICNQLMKIVDNFATPLMKMTQGLHMREFFGEEKIQFQKKSLINAVLEDGDVFLFRLFGTEDSKALADECFWPDLLEVIEKRRANLRIVFATKQAAFKFAFKTKFPFERVSIRYMDLPFWRGTAGLEFFSFAGAFFVTNGDFGLEVSGRNKNELRSLFCGYLWGVAKEIQRDNF